MKKFFQLTATAFAVFLLLFFTSCNSNRLDVDISDIEVKLDIRHFEDDLFENKLTDYSSFFKKYPYFLSDYTLGILNFPFNTAEEAFPQLMLYKTDVNVKAAYSEVKAKYANFKPYEEELTTAYKYFKYHFPDQKIPSIITYFSHFSFYMNVVGQDYIGIGLDMHMGENFKYYEYAGIEKYWRKNLIPQSIVTNHMLAQANDLFLKSNRKKNFIDEMIYQGKLLYFLDATTPTVPDYIKIGMTQKEFEWCKAEEHNIWSFIVKEKYLYDTEVKNYERLINEGPKTIAPGVPPDAPSKIGKYVGWMAVRQYMNENSDVSLSELMNDGNAEQILQKSAYKP